MSTLPVAVRAEEFEGYRPLPEAGLDSVFQHLWTRLNEAETIATVLAMQPAGTDAFNQTLRALLQVANVRGAYQHMANLLATARSDANARELDLLSRLAAAQRDNHQLRERLREFKDARGVA